MTQLEKKGKVLALIIACAVVLPNLLGVIALALARSPMLNGFLLLPLGITLALSWCLIKGRNWARWYFVFTSPIAILYFAVKAMGANGVLGLIPILPFLIVMLGIALVLWKSPSIAAYFEREVPDKQAILTMKDHGGV